MLQDGLGRGFSEGVSNAATEFFVGMPLRWLTVALIALSRGVTLSPMNDPGETEAWLWIGLASLLFFSRDLAVWVGQRRRKAQPKVGDLASLIEVLRLYGVEEFGGLYLYIPSPPRHEDRNALAWLQILKARQIVLSGPWRIEASRAPPWLNKAHPQLVSENVMFLDIYRLRRDPLGALL
jgi:hypothetical protein